MEERKVKKGSYGYSDNGYLDFIDCMHKSWPWQRLNENEKNTINNIFDLSKSESETEYCESWERGEHIWHNCLLLVGYQPFHWREDKEGNIVIPPCDEEYILVPRKQLQALKDAISNLNTMI